MTRRDAPLSLSQDSRAANPVLRRLSLGQAWHRCVHPSAQHERHFALTGACIRSCYSILAVVFVHRNHPTASIPRHSQSRAVKVRFVGNALPLHPSGNQTKSQKNISHSRDITRTPASTSDGVLQLGARRRSPRDDAHRGEYTHI